jgi:membrane protease YdiL (CAAX protease family)
MHKSTTRNIVFLVALWVATAAAKSSLTNVFVLHTALACLLAAAGFLVVLRGPNKNERPLRFGLQAPTGRVGYRISVGYLLLTVAIFAAMNPGTWQNLFPKIINDAFSSNNFLLAVLAAPLYEEFFFRGCLQPAILQEINSAVPENSSAEKSNWSIYLSALIFWIFHIPLAPSIWSQAWAANAIPISPGPFFLGLACAFLANRESSIWYAVLLHIFANLIGPIWGGMLPSSVLPFFYAL